MALSASGATYYIDYAGGSDSNSGLSSTSAWMRHPYMQGWMGRYTHAAGDKFIFKGGVTWPHAAFGMSISSGGTAASSDYYGVDKTWFAGSSWARPIFNNDGTSGNTYMTLSANYITIDNIEFTGFYWSGCAYGTSMIGVGLQNYVVIENCFFHNWSHASVASGCCDGLQIILGNARNPGTGNVINNCIFDGSPNGTDSGMACYHMSTVKNSIARNMANGFLLGINCLADGCTVGPINVSFDSTQHENGIETLDGGSCTIRNCVLFNTTAVCIYVANDPCYIYNNVCYANTPIAIQTDPMGASATMYVYNNTVESSGVAVRCVPRTGAQGSVVLRNNHFINDSTGNPYGFNSGSGTVNSVVSDHNVIMSHSAATSQGYVARNNYAPTSSSGGTVDVGTDESSIFNYDILGVSRPQGAAWDAGAYEYSASATPSVTVSPTSLNFGSVAVGSTADLTVTVRNTNSATISGAASVGAPFSIVSGSPYSLTAGQSQTITVRYSPTAAGNDSQSLSLIGGRTASCQLTGTAVSVAQPVITVTPSSQNFGSVTVGTTLDKTFTVVNSGSGTLSGAVSVGMPFSVVSGSPYSLGVGQSQVVTVRYSPTSSGTNTQNVTFTGGNGATGQVSGVALPAPLPILTVTPSTQNFGSITLGGTADLVFTVQNTGTGPLSGTATVAAPFSVVSGSPYTVAVGQSQVVTVRYSPTSSGTNTQNVTFTGGAGATCQVKGVAVPAPLPILAVTPSTQSYGTITLGGTADQNFTVKNTGTGSLSGTATVAAPFAIVSGSPYTLGAGQSQVVTVRYTPTAAGTNTQNVTFTGGVGASCQVSGVAIAAASPILSVTPSSQNFGSITVGTTADQVFTVKNTGTGTLSGAASVPAPFSIVSNGSYILTAGQSQAITVRYSPTTPGTNAQIVVFTGAAGASLPVSGVATIQSSTLSVSDISQNGIDIDPVTAGLQLFAGSTIQYSGSASDSSGQTVNWQWIYTTNGGPEIVYQSGTGAVASVSYVYPDSTAGYTYLWKLRASDGTYTAESDLTVGVEAPPAPIGGLILQAKSAAVTGAFQVTNGYFYQPKEITVVSNAGSVTFNFRITNAGSYVVQAMVNAPDDSANSVLLNIDSQPVDPVNIWDIAVTTGFESRVASARGNGTYSQNQYVPKVFNLTKGSHQLIIRGREAGVLFQSVAISRLPVLPPVTNVRIVSGP